MLWSRHAKTKYPHRLAYPCSLALCLCASVANPICRPFVFSCLQTLFLSLRSFPRSHRLFSIACGLFSQNTRDGGVTAAPVSPFVLVSVQPRTSNLEPLPLRALDTAGSAAYGFAQRARGNRKLR